MTGSDLSQNLSKITDVLKEYLNTKVDFVKLGLLQKITKAGTYLLTFVALLVSIFAIALFLMFSFSHWYGEETGNLAMGFLLSSAFFLVVLIVIYLARNILFTRNLIKIFSRILFSEDEN
jgi:magnesium-transporting ATPase (P-type)